MCEYHFLSTFITKSTLYNSYWVWKDNVGHKGTIRHDGSD